MCERESECVCERESECVCVGERKRVCVCVCERANISTPSVDTHSSSAAHSCGESERGQKEIGREREVERER